ncbi:MAG TPA: pitrilysin family protein [Gemmatimonadaceae bacterium]|nr:pitrilysin family protein [Gemmatimonadaceae bacterium]
MIRTSLFVAMAITAAALPAAAQREAPPAPGTPSNFTVPPKREFSLQNGMEVTLVPYGTIPKVTVRLATRVGNVNETAQQTWLGDLMSDLMEQGTRTRTAEQLAMEVASMGGALDVAFGEDLTTIGGDVLSEFGPRMVALVADVARNPRFPETELARLKADRVRQVTIAKSQPQPLAQERFRAVIYGEHPAGRMFPTADQLQGYTIQQVRDFYAANFGAARSHLYVSGRFDATTMERAIRDAFGDWARGPAPVTNIPKPTSSRAIHLIDRPGAVQSTIYMGLPVPDPSSEDYVALQVTNALLGGSFGSRITSNIRERKGYTYSPFSQVSARYRSAFWVEVADVTTNVTGASLKEIFHEIDSLQAVPPSAEELRGIQNYLAGTFVLGNSSRAGIIGQLQLVDLHGLPDNFLQTYVQKIHAVTPADVQRIARTYLKDDQMTIVVVGDKKTIAEQLAPFGKVVD